MNLIIDQGNTATKLAIFEGEIFLKKNSFPKEEKQKVENWVTENCPLDTKILISSVTNQELNFSHQNCIRFTHETPIPIENTYATPLTLGLDRLANAVGAWSKNKKGNSLVIDMGTCIKYDIVITNEQGKGQYLGGNISPGLRMRYQALNGYTDKLPLLVPEKEFEYSYGKTTETSMKNGVQHAIYHEIKGFIQRYQEELGELTIFMTGGDIKYFDKAFKNTIFADSDLTIFGLNEILIYNVEY